MQSTGRSVAVKIGKVKLTLAATVAAGLIGSSLFVIPTWASAPVGDSQPMVSTPTGQAQTSTSPGFGDMYAACQSRDEDAMWNAMGNPSGEDWQAMTPYMYGSQADEPNASSSFPGDMMDDWYGRDWQSMGPQMDDGQDGQPSGSSFPGAMMRGWSGHGMMD